MYFTAILNMISTRYIWSIDRTLTDITTQVKMDPVVLEEKWVS